MIFKKNNKNENNESKDMKDKSVFPAIPLRDVVIFPNSALPIFIARPFSLHAARTALATDQLAVFVPQVDASVEEPTKDDIASYGVVARFIQHINPPDGSIRALIQGLYRVKIEDFYYNESDEYFEAVVTPAPVKFENSNEEKQLVRLALDYFRTYLQGAHANIPEEVVELINSRALSDPYMFVTAFGPYVPGSTEEKIEILSMPSVKDMLHKVVSILIRELEFQKLKMEIEKRVREEMNRSQRQYFLQQELKEIQKELGYEEEDEFLVIEEKIKNAGMPPEVEERAMSELKKLRRIPPMSPEATVIRNYLDWMVSLPWSKRSEDNLDIKHARKVLDEDHYGLEEPKERILEYLSVLKLKGKLQGQVICFVGPPGVGKTSLAKSIARALGRKFVRISLGGLRDEAEIRGHRRTYIGAMPGRIIQQIKRAGTKNPVFLLDEIDKVGQDWRGDPQAALMEVLDPEVNKNFQDHYIEVDFDLSEVLFITTANTLHTIPRPLLDRMEVIKLRGYLDFEKLQIAKRHLIPKQIERVGIPKGKVRFDDEAIMRMIREYTREAGVRELERVISRVLRKVARLYVEKGKGARITAKNLENYLGKPKYRKKEAVKVLPVGAAYGLAWTAYGGEILKVEVAVMQGKGGLDLTGQLGDVMKESAKAALTYIRAHYRRFNLPQDFYANVDIHLHLPEGAIPKDGPSAGVAILAAMISALTRTPVPGEIAMTGEITLTGEVLPVGGLEEKILAAKRSGIKRVLLPSANRPEIEEMKAEIKEGIELVFVETLDEFVEKVFPENAWASIGDVKGQEYAAWIGMQ